MAWKYIKQNTHKTKIAENINRKKDKKWKGNNNNGRLTFRSWKPKVKKW